MSQRGPEWESQRAVESRERASKSQREPEKVRKGLREPVRASGSQSGSQREPERASKSLREPVRAREGQGESQ